jgi:hypothetical protein
MYTLNKEDFSRYIGGRHREALTIFNDLDTDYDGKVDIFEVFVVLTIWSGTNWEEKQELLFMVFDMMDKKFLKVDEVMLMGTLLVQTMNKFVKDKDLVVYGKHDSLQEFAKLAFSQGNDKLNLEDFKSFSNRIDVTPLQQLRGFIEDHAAKGQPPSVESRMRLQLSGLEKHVSKLFEHLGRLQEAQPDCEVCAEFARALGRKKRWEFVMQNLTTLELSLRQEAESMNTTLADLSSSLKEDEASKGLSSIVEPYRRFQQEQMVSQVEQLRQQSLTDFRKATELLRRIIEFTEPHEASPVADQGLSGMNAIREEEHEHLSDMSPAYVVESRNVLKQVYNEMLKEINPGGSFTRDTEGYQQLVEGAQKGSDGTSAKEATQMQANDAGAAEAMAAEPPSDIPTLIAIADFEPPATHQSQMLRLIIGDTITVSGQDGKGWWYGKKQDGTEGWFPPSYVQLKGAHRPSI